MREVQAQREVLGQLVLPDILVHIRLLHVAQRQPEALAGEQSLVQVVPGAVGQEMAGGVAALEIERVLRLPRGVERQLVHPAMQRRSFLLQVDIQLGGGELVAQEILHLGGVLDLPLMRVEILERFAAAALCGQDLALDLLDLDRQDVDLVVPFLQPPRPAGLGEFETGGGASASATAIRIRAPAAKAPAAGLPGGNCA